MEPHHFWCTECKLELFKDPDDIAVHAFACLGARHNRDHVVHIFHNGCIPLRQCTRCPSCNAPRLGETSEKEVREGDIVHHESFYEDDSADNHPSEAIHIDFIFKSDAKSSKKRRERDADGSAETGGGARMAARMSAAPSGGSGASNSGGSRASGSGGGGASKKRSRQPDGGDGSIQAEVRPQPSPLLYSRQARDPMQATHARPILNAANSRQAIAAVEAARAAEEAARAAEEAARAAEVEAAAEAVVEAAIAEVLEEAATAEVAAAAGVEAIVEAVIAEVWADEAMSIAIFVEEVRASAAARAVMAALDAARPEEGEVIEIEDDPAPRDFQTIFVAMRDRFGEAYHTMAEIFQYTVTRYYVNNTVHSDVQASYQDLRAQLSQSEREFRAIMQMDVIIPDSGNEEQLITGWDNFRRFINIFSMITMFAAAGNHVFRQIEQIIQRLNEANLPLEADFERREDVPAPYLFDWKEEFLTLIDISQTAVQKFFERIMELFQNSPVIAPHLQPRPSVSPDDSNRADLRFFPDAMQAEAFFTIITLFFPDKKIFFNFFRMNTNELNKRIAECIAQSNKLFKDRGYYNNQEFTERIAAFAESLLPFLHDNLSALEWNEIVTGKSVADRLTFANPSLHDIEHRVVRNHEPDEVRRMDRNIVRAPFFQTFVMPYNFRGTICPICQDSLYQQDSRRRSAMLAIPFFCTTTSSSGAMRYHLFHSECIQNAGDNSRYMQQCLLCRGHKRNVNPLRSYTKMIEFPSCVLKEQPEQEKEAAKQAEQQRSNAADRERQEAELRVQHYLEALARMESDEQIIEYEFECAPQDSYVERMYRLDSRMNQLERFRTQLQDPNFYLSNYSGPRYNSHNADEILEQLIQEIERLQKQSEEFTDEQRTVGFRYIEAKRRHMHRNPESSERTFEARYSRRLQPGEGPAPPHPPEAAGSAPPRLSRRERRAIRARLNAEAAAAAAAGQAEEGAAADAGQAEEGAAADAGQADTTAADAGQADTPAVVEPREATAADAGQVEVDPRQAARDAALARYEATAAERHAEEARRAAAAAEQADRERIRQEAERVRLEAERVRRAERDERLRQAERVRLEAERVRRAEQAERARQEAEQAERVRQEAEQVRRAEQAERARQEAEQVRRAEQAERARQEAERAERARQPVERTRFDESRTGVKLACTNEGLILDGQSREDIAAYPSDPYLCSYCSHPIDLDTEVYHFRSCRHLGHQHCFETHSERHHTVRCPLCNPVAAQPNTVVVSGPSTSTIRVEIGAAGPAAVGRHEPGPAAIGRFEPGPVGRALIGRRPPRHIVTPQSTEEELMIPENVQVLDGIWGLMHDIIMSRRSGQATEDDMTLLNFSMDTIFEDPTYLGVYDCSVLTQIFQDIQNGREPQEILNWAAARRK